MQKIALSTRRVVLAAPTPADAHAITAAWVAGLLADDDRVARPWPILPRAAAPGHFHHSGLRASGAFTIQEPTHAAAFTIQEMSGCGDHAVDIAGTMRPKPPAFVG